jgi:large conductance mechanosensitive channel
MKRILQEFKDFAMKGNVLDLAIGVVVGGAFAKIVSSLVENILMPIVGLAAGGVDFSNLSLQLGSGSNAPRWKYGAFLQSVIDFAIIAFCLFVVVKAANALKRKPKDAPPPPPSEVYLKEIRDALVSKK